MPTHHIFVSVCDKKCAMDHFMLCALDNLGKGTTKRALFQASGKNRPAPSALRPGGKSIFRPFSGKKGGKLWSSVIHRKRAENIPNSAL